MSSFSRLFHSLPRRPRATGSSADACVLPNLVGTLALFTLTPPFVEVSLEALNFCDWLRNKCLFPLPLVSRFWRTGCKDVFVDISSASNNISLTKTIAEIAAQLAPKLLLSWRQICQNGRIDPFMRSRMDASFVRSPTYGRLWKRWIYSTTSK